MSRERLRSRSGDERQRREAQRAGSNAGAKLELPVTGWQLLHVQADCHLWRHTCAWCGTEIFEDARPSPDELPAQLQELIWRYGDPVLCFWCQIDGV